MTIGSVADHRSREGGAIIYPVYSRRSGGLSIGINLFPDRKLCSFNCPYCEVFPFKTDIVFNPEIMKAALCSAIREAKENGIQIKDICFSGSGEPSMSPYFIEAVNAVAAIRSGLADDAKLVVITSGTGLQNNDTFEFFKTASLHPVNLNIWLKLDAATEEWYRFMNRSKIPHDELIDCIKKFSASAAPFTIQTMLCRVKGILPPQDESAAWVQLVTELAALSRSDKSGSGLRAVQIYGKARPASEDPLAEAIPATILEERSLQLRLSLEKAGLIVPVEVY
ncbi:MAG: radical SAM protein [Treponema sp.]|nr:radical SAM protein [Treponema sp.]